MFTVDVKQQYNNNNCHLSYRKHARSLVRFAVVYEWMSDVLTCKIASCEKRIYSDQLAQKHYMKTFPAHFNVMDEKKDIPAQHGQNISRSC